MMISRKVQREAREAVIAARFHGAPAPANPYRRQTQSHRWWNTGVRRAELALDELMRIGA